MSYLKVFLAYLLYAGISAGLIIGLSVHTGRCDDEAPKTTVDEFAESVPSLADVVYRAGSLGQQLADLKIKIDSLDELQKLNGRLQRAKAQIDLFSKHLGTLNADNLQNYQQLAALKGEVRSESEAVTRSVDALAETIRKVETWRRQWTAEKKLWAQWRSVLGEDLTLQSVSDAFSRSSTDINNALELISLKLEPLLAVQQNAGDIGARFHGLLEQINAMMLRQRGGALRGGTPTMFSTGYIRQLIDLALEPGKSFNALPPPDLAFFSDNGWVIALQVLVLGVLFILLRHYRSQMLEHAHRRFLGKRQLSVSVFVAIFTLSFLYGPQPAIWRMLLQTLAAVATARLASSFVREAWVKRAIYVLVLVVIGFQLLLILGVQLALMRLFILVWTLAGIIYYGWRIQKKAVIEKPTWPVWLLRLVVLAFGLLAGADFIGLGGFSVQLMDGAIRTAVFLLMGWVMIRLARVALELGVESLPMENFAFLRRNATIILSRAILVCNVLIVAFVAANLLVAWKLYAIPVDVFHDFFTFGVTISGQKITVGLMLMSGAILYGAFALSWGLQNLLMENVLSRRQMDTGAKISIARLLHYSLVLVGFIFALSSLGFELKNITIIGGALGVGIGFGMQTIVNNFVCGLILLFERPIKVGDVIQLTDGQQGRVLNLGLRATTIQTFDRAEIVVPNSDLIASQVVNWTLGDRSIRLTIPVGVAYGSDVETVMRELTEVAAQNPHVLKPPQPLVLFLNFGESSLDFELRVWITDFNDRWIIQSELNRDIDRRFRAAGVEIPFPQRDLHLRSVDAQAAGRLKGQETADPVPSPPQAGTPVAHSE
jgi:potassium-dependent mechanosensitive channel